MNQREKVTVSNRMPGIAFWADFELLLQAGAGSYHDLSSRFDLSRILLSSPGELLVCLVSIKLGDDVVDGLVDVELFAAENVDEGRIFVREGMYADVALSDYDEAADSPFRRILSGVIDERVGRSDLVHPDNIGKLV